MVELKVKFHLCETLFSNKRPEKSDIIKAKNLGLSGVRLKEDEAAMLFSCLLIAVSLLNVFS